jgi:hypothetical protein
MLDRLNHDQKKIYERNITPWSQLTRHRRSNYYMRLLMNTVTMLSLRSESVRRSTQR